MREKQQDRAGKRPASERTIALQATVESWYDRDHLLQHLGDMRLAGMLDLAGPAEQKVRLRVSASGWQIDLASQTVFGSGTTFVRRRDGSAELFHHGTATRLAIPAEEIPAASVGRAGRWEVSDSAEETKGEGEKKVFSVTLHDAASNGRWVQRITCQRDVAPPELAREFAEALLAGGNIQQTSAYPLDQVLERVDRHGIPTEITLHSETPQAPPISWVRITGIRIGDDLSATDKRFDEYSDMREPSVWKRWMQPGPGLREVPLRNLEDVVQDEDALPEGAALRMRRRDGDNDWEPPEPPERPPRGDRPVPAITTNAAQVALRIEQRLLDDAQRTINSIAAHLRGVSTNGTDLVIPWLEDVVASARTLDPIDPNGNRLDTVPGTALAALLHEDTRRANLKTCKVGGGKGIIDRQAATKARDYLTSGMVPPYVLSSLAAGDLSEVTAALANTDPAARFAMLSTGAAAALIAAVAFEDIGTLRFSLAKLRESINIKDLYFIQLIDFAVALGFPPAPAVGAGAPGSLEAPLVTGLRCRSGGSIDGAISLTNLSVDATILRLPMPLYWVLLVAGAPLIPIFFPMFAWVIPILWALTIFFATDIARVRLDARPLSAVFNISFRAEQTNSALRPSVSVRLVGSVRTRMLSYFPDGLHQIIDWTLAELTNLFGITLGVLQAQLGQQLSNLLRTVMGDGVPGSLMRLGVPVASGQAAGEDDNYVYLESTFDTPPDPSIRITPVPVSAALRWDLARDVDRVFGPNGSAGRGRHYVSLGASINAINQVAAVLWKRGAYEAFLPASSLSPLRPLLAAPFSGPLSRADVVNSSPPVFSFPAAGPSAPWYFADVVFPSFVVVVNKRSAHKWMFRYRITCRAVFGIGTVPPARSFLSLSGIQPNIVEPLLDPGTIALTLLEATESEETTITVQDSGDDPRHPQVIRTHHEVVTETTDRTAGAPASWTQFGSGVFILSNWWRHPAILPRLDQVTSTGTTSAWPADGLTQHTYDSDGMDPDNASPTLQGITVPGNAHLPVDWGFLQGLCGKSQAAALGKGPISSTPPFRTKLQGIGRPS